MAKGIKTGGRKRGTPNLPGLEAWHQAKSLGIDPFEILLHFAAGNWEALGYDKPTKTLYTQMGIPFEVDLITAEMRLHAAAKACPFLIPQRKAIHVSATQNVNVQVTRTDVKEIARDPEVLGALHLIESKMNKKNGTDP